MSDVVGTLHGALARIPGVVWAATALLFALLLAYSLLYPAYLAPDEPQHVDMVVELQHHPFHWPGPGERPLGVGVAASSDMVYRRGARRLGPYLPAEAVPRAQRRSLGALGDDRPSPTPPRYPNQIVQHPPLYYAIEATLASAVPTSVHWHYDQFVWLLRFFSILMVTPIPILAWATTRRLVAVDGVAARAAAFLPLGVPGFARMGATVNNDNLLILLCSILVFALVPVPFGDTSRSRALKVGAALGLAIFTKALAVVFIPVVAAAYVVAWWRAPERRRAAGTTVGATAIAMAVAFALGGWWFLRNKIVYGRLQPNGFGDATWRRILASLRVRPVRRHTVAHWWHLFWPQMRSRFWGSLGLLEPPRLPNTLVTVLTALVIIGLVIGVARGPRRAPSRRDVTLLLAAPIALLFVAVGHETYSALTHTGYPGGMQGRYLYPALVATAAVLAVAIAKDRPRRAPVLRFVPLGLALCAVVMHAEAIRLVVTQLWLRQPSHGSELTKLRDAASAITHWSPFPRVVTAVPFVLVVLAAIAAVTACAVDAVRADAPVPVSPS